MFENDSDPDKIEIDWPPAASARVNRSDGNVRPHRPARSRMHRVRLVVGRVFLSSGLLLFGFVAYQLWGTRFQEAHSQDTLSGRFEQVLAASGSATTAPPAQPTTTAGGSAATAPATTARVATTAPVGTTAPAPTTAPSPGDPVAHLVIPKIGVDKIVVSGVAVEDLRKGPGHFPETPLPGERGNASIAGHRTTFGAPFNRIDELAVGDRIEATTAGGTFVYLVSEAPFVVRPSQYDVVGPTDAAVLTLVSCDPKLSATNRIIVRAALDPTASSTVGEPAARRAAATGVLPGDDTTTSSTAGTGTGSDAGSSVATSLGGGTGGDVGNETAAGTRASAATTDAFQQGWFSDQLAWADVAIWGGLLTAVSLLAWQLSRRTRNLVGGLVGLLPFLFVLYFVYENVSRLLPPNL